MNKRVIFCTDWDEAAAFDTDPAVHIPAWREAFEAYCAEIGLSLTDGLWDEITAGVVGRAEPLEVMAFVERANALGMPNLTRERLYELRTERVGYWRGPRGQLRSPPGFLDAVRAVNANRGKNCIVTGAGGFILDRMVHWLGLDQHFPHAHRISSDDPRVYRCQRFKPDPYPWSLALAEAGATDNDIKVFYEDSVKVAIPLIKSGLFDFGYLLVKSTELIEVRKRELQDNDVDPQRLKVVTNLFPFVRFLNEL